MTDKTHQILGLATATVGFFVIHPDIDLTWSVAGTLLFGSFFGSILPDIDQPTSNFWDSVPLGKIINRPLAKTLGGHRNLSHSILGFLLFTWIVGWLFTALIRPDSFVSQVIFLESFQLGFIAHLIADSVTVQGIPVFWPLGGNMGFPPRPLHGARILTGKWFENLVVFPVSILGFIFLLANYSNRLCLILSDWLCR
ncbi:metal-dependent hydrolase [Candidatus Berkelbacteria bacterium]|nr:metal-dependent hydrolase [Candidatus Berkelbacteria bacterium]